MEGAQKKKPWMRRHHRVVRDIAYLVLHRYTVRRYGIDIEKFSAQGERAYLILMNHQTAFDQFFVGMTFKGPVYYVASEDLFSNGFISTLLRWAVAPIPIKKQTSDISAVKNCIRVAKEGGTIAIAPEGNRTYSGRTGYMNPAIAALAKLIKLPIAFLRIEGGYGVHPRWSDAVRKGHMRCYVSRVMEPEEFKSLSKQELHEVIERELYEDEGTADAEFDSDVRAEYLERAMYVCPWCGLSEFESRGNYIECKRCRRKVEYGKDKRLRGQGFDFPFEFVTGWYDPLPGRAHVPGPGRAVRGHPLQAQAEAQKGRRALPLRRQAGHRRQELPIRRYHRHLGARTQQAEYLHGRKALAAQGRKAVQRPQICEYILPQQESGQG